MRQILIALIALTLAACAGTQQIGGSATGSSFHAVGTLASFGSYEWATAADATRIEVLSHRAAVRLRAWRISADQARAVHAAGTQALAALRAGAQAHAAGDTAAASAATERARAQIDIMQSAMEDRK